MAYWVKDATGMMVLDRSLELPLHQQGDYLTPNDRFFVCNSGSTPRIDAQRYVLRIIGDGVSNDLRLNYNDLAAMPHRTVPAVLECAGNHRSLFLDVTGEQLNNPTDIPDVMWTLGGVGMAEWRGVCLRHVLDRAGIKDTAYHVCPKGSETDAHEGEIKIPIPVNKAMDEDTILALEMNGEPLPPDHGFPVRVIVPGWIGAYSVKWVREIEVSATPMQVTRNTDFYVLKGDNWPEEGIPITEQNLKSSLALPWPARLTAGDHTIHGFARSPRSPINEVCWSDDQGKTWRSAQLTGPIEKYGWVRFHFSWRATPGRHVLMTRATNRAGRTQPETVPFNAGGYLFNAVHPHPVFVD